MRVHQTIAENGKQLRRIAALLFALGDLAERAAGRPGAVCFLVLWLIRPGEAVARDYVEKIAPGAAWLPAPEPLRPRAAAAEALRLAQVFRALAVTLAALAQFCLAARQAAPASCLSAGRVAPSPAIVIPWRCRPPCPP